MERPEPSTDRPALRTDIQALRALAVVSVVLFHLWPHRLPGGFVGVDVFFVISGYLIIGHLVGDLEQSGRMRLGRFWAARARRLLPASLLTLLSVTIGVFVVVPRSLWDQFLAEIVASAAYVQNWQLALSAVDYFDSDNPPSPVRHFWSLAAEEQFYVVLPLLIWAAATGASRAGLSRVRLIQIAVAAVTVASFAHCVLLTGSNPDVAYFSTFTRMWEFGLGGLASFGAAAATAGSRRFARAPGLATVVGLAAIVVALFALDTGTPFPGYAALLPVLGTVAVLRWGDSTIVASLGARQPVAMLGRTSYALYLWHWPLIILVPYVTFRDLSRTDKFAILVVGVVIAWVSTRLVEEPLRFKVARRIRPRMVFLVAAAATAPVLVLAVAGQQLVAHERSVRAADQAKLLQQMPDCFGAASMDPHRQPCRNPALRGVVVPHPADALHDRLRRDGCTSDVDDAIFAVCVSGPKKGYRLHLVLVGDSHARTLLPAIDWIAEKHRWRIDTITHGGCYWTAAEQRRRSERQKALCNAWQRKLAAVLARPNVYDAVMTTHATSDRLVIPPGQTKPQTTIAGMVEAWTTEVPPHLPIIALVDNPRSPWSNTTCVERWGTTSPERCAVDRRWALHPFDGQAEAVAQVPNASLIDLTEFFCGPKTCPAVIGGVMVHRDRTHLTATYVRTLAPYLDAPLVAALGEHGLG